MKTSRLLPRFICRITVLLLLPGFSLLASDWPPGLVQKTYNGCMKNGGKSQCDCLITRLQYQFTFDDVKMAMTNRFAHTALQQAISTYNMKCLEADFKRETEQLTKDR